MNATEDGYPVGEGPIDTLDAIERGAVIGLQGAGHQAARRTADSGAQRNPCSTPTRMPRKHGLHGA